MFIYYLEFRNSVKFFNRSNDFTIEITNETILYKFLRKCKERKCKLVNMITGEVLK